MRMRGSKKNSLQSRIRAVEVELRSVRDRLAPDTSAVELRRWVWDAKAHLDQLWAELHDVPLTPNEKEKGIHE